LHRSVSQGHGPRPDRLRHALGFRAPEAEAIHANGHPGSDIDFGQSDMPSGLQIRVGNRRGESCLAPTEGQDSKRARAHEASPGKEVPVFGVTLLVRTRRFKKISAKRWTSSSFH